MIKINDKTVSAVYRGGGEIIKIYKGLNIVYLKDNTPQINFIDISPISVDTGVVVNSISSPQYKGMHSAYNVPIIQYDITMTTYNPATSSDKGFTLPLPVDRREYPNYVYRNSNVLTGGSITTRVKAEYVSTSKELNETVGPRQYVIWVYDKSTNLLVAEVWFSLTEMRVPDVKTKTTRVKVTSLLYLNTDGTEFDGGDTFKINDDGTVTIPYKCVYTSRYRNTVLWLSGRTTYTSTKDAESFSYGEVIVTFDSKYENAISCVNSGNDGWHIENGNIMVRQGFENTNGGQTDIVCQFDVSKSSTSNYIVVNGVFESYGY